MKNTVQVAKVVGLEVSDPGNRGYIDFEVEVKTEAGITMVLVLPHIEADKLRAKILGVTESMPPAARWHSFRNSARRYLSKAKAAA
ncbi:hypothetical protein ACFVXW_25430 [Streptomyces sp. NPDC058251]|uniref:hypothetical protein n=1 Tax=Streptomyces sp. NPDC058251 TaxID=3346404 RepID=UPI0036E00CEF